MGRTCRTTEADPLGRKRGRPGRPKSKKECEAPKTGFEGNAQAPWRKTVSIFKMPTTTVLTSHRETKAPKPEQLKKRSPGEAREDKPFQLMWAKALEGLTCSVPTRLGDKADVERDEYIEESLQLAGRLTKVCDAMSERAVAAHICSTVHHPLQMGVYGQKTTKEKLAENLLYNYDPNQPMIQYIDKIALEDDIRAQEKRVLDARKRLQEVLKHFG